jgi:hypothetical protein
VRGGEPFGDAAAVRLGTARDVGAEAMDNAGELQRSLIPSVPSLPAIL